MAKSKYSSKSMGKSYAKSNGKYSKNIKGGSGKVMGHASGMSSISTNSEKYDMGKIQNYTDGSKGYPSQAFDYQW